MCRLLFDVRSIPVLPQWHVKDPDHFAKSAGGRLHLNTHTPLTQRSRSGPTMPLSADSAGTSPETSSHATCQGTFGHSRLSSLSHCMWTDPSIKSGMSVRELIFTLTTTTINNTGGESMVEHSPRIMASKEKATSTTATCVCV